MSFITLIIVISILVFVHELGHFLVAKRSGVRVDEFAVGFPPRIWSKQVGETAYSINLIPFGGYVKIFGENPDDESVSGPDSGRSFVKKPRHIQAAILVAGVAMNILFAWMLIVASLTMGVSQVSDSSAGRMVVVTDVVKSSPAEMAGIKAGDLITDISIRQKVKDEALPNDSTISSEKIKEMVASSFGAPITFTYIRSDKTVSVEISPKEGVVKDKYAVGIQMADIDNKKLGFLDAIVEGTKMTYDLFIQTTLGTLKFFGSAFTFSANLNDVSGPVGIAGYLNQAREFGFSTLLTFVAMISINLAVINLFPFPALDGGRLLFVGIEAIIRRPISPKIANTVNLVGFSILMILMITVTVSDIGKLF
jgi:regulator of sigma E protease